jgi:DNA-binding CsgD family transcriptional regulator
MPAVVVGRDAELASIRDFVTGISDGASALVLEGEAGMGKTTLWRAGVEAAEAAGLCVLRAEPAESEIALSFSGLGDLLDPVLDEALAPLAAGQRSALARALVLEEVEGPAPDAHAAGVALLNALRGLASTRGLLVAVDDVQWFDVASAAALAYAARRLRSEHVGVLLARRAGLESSLVDELGRTAHHRNIDVGPLDLGALHQVVQAHLDVALPRPLLAEVHQASGGNPFFALEIVRTLTRSGVSVEAGKPLPVPDSLHDLVHGRLLALPPQSREFLVAAAAHAHPTISTTEAASGVGRAIGLAPALEARIVEIDGDRIRFTHPLLAAGAYETADVLRRREIHAALAERLEEPEARAWQLAASVEDPDETVATVLEAAAQHARARGAPRPAALLLDRASALTPSDHSEEGLRRAVDAAYLHFESGDSPRAEAQLEQVVAGLGPGRDRARAVTQLGRVRSDQSLTEAVALFSQALDEAEGEREIIAGAHEGVAISLFFLHERLDRAIGHAELAAELAIELHDEALAGEALGSQLLAETILGLTSATATSERALALQEVAQEQLTREPVRRQPLVCVAACWRWTNEVAQARDVLRELLERALEVGDESSRPLLLMLLGEAECTLGELESARMRALEGRKLAEQSGQQTLRTYHLALESLVEAHRGREERARSAAREAMELVPGTGARLAELLVTRALGHLELALGAPSEAVARMEAFLAFVQREAIVEPGFIPFVVDHVEALVELGRTDEAVELLDWYEGNARRLDRASALANSLRCRGLLAAQEGELDDAIAAHGEALEWHAKVELPLDRGRTLLALGAAQRRAKRRREARETLEDALAIFERIGAALWAERARAELSRISGRAATPGALTPAEERVAALVAEGKTNREVAAALFLSDRTVEGHLSHVFGKLGIRHRAEVGHALASRQTQGIAESNTGDSPVSAESVAP